MAASGPLTPAELAQRTGTVERCVREWLAAQAAAGYVTYDPSSGRYALPAEHAVALTDESSPACVLGGFQGITAAMRAEPRVAEAFRHGRGVGWHEHDPDLFIGTERFFRPGYHAHLVDEWIPALDGAHERLEAGAEVADVGCGHGASTVILAQAFPRSHFVGFDYHAPSVAAATERARAAGVGDRVRFEVATAKTYPGTYDLVACFDCLHDMGDPLGAAAHVRESLRPDGTWMLVEPFAHDRTEQNLNALGRLFYSVSTLVCTQASLAQEVGTRSAPRPARRACATSSPAPASAASGAPPRRPSTSSSRRARRTDRRRRWRWSGGGSSAVLPIAAQSVFETIAGTERTPARAAPACRMASPSAAAHAASRSPTRRTAWAMRTPDDRGGNPAVKFPRIYADERGETHIGVRDIPQHEARVGRRRTRWGR